MEKDEIIKQQSQLIDEQAELIDILQGKRNADYKLELGTNIKNLHELAIHLDNRLRIERKYSDNLNKQIEEAKIRIDQHTKEWKELVQLKNEQLQNIRHTWRQFTNAIEE